MRWKDKTARTGTGTAAGVNDIEQAWWTPRTLANGRTLEAVISPLRPHGESAWIVA